MLKFSLLFICFVFGVVTSCHQTCTENKSINTGCNTCTCHSGQWSCTEKFCNDKECVANDYRGDCNDCKCIEGRWECTGCPGTCGNDCPACKSINIGCNTCACKDGHWACTKRACANPTKECNPAEYKGYCGDCACIEGKWNCKCCHDEENISVRR